MSSHVPTILLGNGNTMIEDTVPTLKKFKPQQEKQANKQMITGIVWWEYVHLSPRTPGCSFSVCFRGSAGWPLNVTVP